MTEFRKKLAAAIGGEQIFSWQQQWTEAENATEPQESLGQIVFEQHKYNHLLWKEEDKARDPDADDSTIAAVKRRIDKLNQKRNDLIETVNDAILEQLTGAGVTVPSDAPWNSETPGSIIDRMSIMALKVYYMNKQVEREDVDEVHREGCRQKQVVLTAQREDLATSLDTLFGDLFAGRKQMKLYRQYKMYNDPAMNPYLVKAVKHEGRKAKGSIL